jgi:flavin-dependent dehydrogenase
LPKPSSSYDLVIIGGGPAGSAAAISARRHNLTALIVEQAASPPPGTCPGWLGPAAIRQCEECGLEAATIGVPFEGLRLWPENLAACARLDDPALKGRLVDPPALGAALLDRARAVGADVLQPTVAAQLQLGEANVTIHLSDGRSVVGQVAVIASGAASPVARMAHLGMSPAAENPSAGAYAAFETAQAASGLDVIIGGGRNLRLATIVRRDRQVRVTLLTRDLSSPAATQLASLLEAARAGDILPGDFAAQPSAVPGLAGLALELESHVGKRCLVVGEAGGFVSAFSNEGLYPALRSGWLAAQTAARALSAPVLQDELATFSADWRADLADYLRMPNTDLGLLLPMVFSNLEMSRRMGRAFLLGQAF